MRRVTGPAGSIVVEEHGEAGALPVMLVHGMAGDAGFWSSTVRVLRARHRLIVPELRGHGRSERDAAGDYSIPAHADDLEAVLDALELRGVILVGHSFGASVVMEAAARNPDRVAGIVLLDAAGDFSYVPPEALSGFLTSLGSEPHYAETLEGAIDVALEGATPETERRVRAAMLTAPQPMVVSMYESLLRYRPTVVLDEYGGPTLVVTAPANGAAFALHVLRPALPRHALRDVSHWVMLDQPGEVARLIDEMVQGINRK